MFLEADGASRAKYVEEVEDSSDEGVPSDESKSLLELNALFKGNEEVADLMDLSKEELENWMTEMKITTIDKKMLRKACAETHAAMALSTEEFETGDEKQIWHCPHCTLHNDVCEPICVVCGHLPPAPRSVASDAVADTPIASEALVSDSVDTPILGVDLSSAFWRCDACTYHNSDMQATQCELCYTECEAESSSAMSTPTPSPGTVVSEGFASETLQR